MRCQCSDYSVDHLPHKCEYEAWYLVLNSGVLQWVCADCKRTPEIRTNVDSRLLPEPEFDSIQRAFYERKVDPMLIHVVKPRDPRLVTDRPWDPIALSARVGKEDRKWTRIVLS